MRIFPDESEKFHKRLFNVYMSVCGSSSNLETINRVHKAEIVTLQRWKAFSENKKFHKCLFDIYMNVQFK